MFISDYIVEIRKYSFDGGSSYILAFVSNSNTLSLLSDRGASNQYRVYIFLFVFQIIYIEILVLLETAR